jgi:polysaccharide biosynthesis/export protein
MKPGAIAILFVSSTICFAQDNRRFLPPPQDFTSNRPSDSPTSSGDYIIGSDDQLDIEVYEIQELASQPRVTSNGKISMKMLGAFQAGGLTPHELERQIEQALKDRQLINDPHVTVFVREYASQPVAILGAVRMPNIYQIKGQKNLYSMISMAQGLDLTTVGSHLQVIRAPKADGQPGEVITISIEDFQRGISELDIPIRANDTINVQVAGSIFVHGEVMKPDEYVLHNGKNLTVLQALTKGGGKTKEAKMTEARIIRYHIGEKGEPIPEEIAVNFDEIGKGKAEDILMMPNDILFVPPNKIKAALNRTLESTIGVVTGRLIYRF